MSAQVTIRPKPLFAIGFNPRCNNIRLEYVELNPDALQDRFPRHNWRIIYDTDNVQEVRDYLMYDLRVVSADVSKTLGVSSAKEVVVDPQHKLL